MGFVIALDILREVKEYDRKEPKGRKRWSNSEYVGMDRLDRERKRREDWRAAGLCVRCGHPKNPLSFSNCDYCLEYRRLQYKPLGKKVGRPVIPRQKLRRKRTQE